MFEGHPRGGPPGSTPDAGSTRFFSRLSRVRPRNPEDRRKTHPLFADWKWALRGRRRGSRRTDDGEEAANDRYGRKLVATVLAVLVFSGLDATFTLVLLSHGLVQEWNPVMRVLIEHDVQMFANVKTALTASALILLVPCHASVVLGRIPVRSIINWLAIGYAGLVLYEITLMALFVW